MQYLIIRCFCGLAVRCSSLAVVNTYLLVAFQHEQGPGTLLDLALLAAMVESALLGFSQVQKRRGGRLAASAKIIDLGGVALSQVVTCWEMSIQRRAL